MVETIRTSGARHAVSEDGMVGATYSGTSLDGTEWSVWTHVTTDCGEYVRTGNVERVPSLNVDCQTCQGINADHW